MRKQIDFAPYQWAEVKEIMEDGSVLCNLQGEAKTEREPLQQYTDTDILFPPNSSILSLSTEEKELIKAEAETTQGDIELL